MAFVDDDLAEGVVRVVGAQEACDPFLGVQTQGLVGRHMNPGVAGLVDPTVPHIAPWEAWTWEGSSLLSLLLVLVFPWLATTIAPPDEAAGEGWRPKARFAAVHFAGLLAFSVFHVAGFVLLRSLAYDLMDAGPYVFGDRFIYELRKDLLTYAAYVATFWLVAWLRRRRDEPVRPVSFDIRDGARIIRVPLTDIAAVSSAGNYVEFWLADGRRPLMRATLAAVEVELEPFDFVRAHRSWLVNATKVTGLSPDGSGDWTIALGAVEAPLSRRYPGALERLKAPPENAAVQNNRPQTGSAFEKGA